MTPPSEQIHDLAGGRRRFVVESLGDPLFDLLLSMWSAFGGDDRVAAHEMGTKWFDRFRESIPEETRRRMAGVGLDLGMLWIGLLGALIEEGPRPFDTDAALAWLDDNAASLPGMMLRDLAHGVDDETLAGCLSGDPSCWDSAVEAMKPEARAAMNAFLAAGPEKAGVELVSILHSVRDTAFRSFEAEWTHPIQRAVEATERLADDLEPTELIERVSNGISYAVPLGTTRLALVPSISLRPWTLVTEAGSSLVVVYPVADEHLEHDADAPPGWLVRAYKALGDERRLRILRRLSEGEASLTELTELVGLAKSTVFHHIGVLRAAGLIRVAMSHDREVVYGLRTKTLDEAAARLGSYLEPADQPIGVS